MILYSKKNCPTCDSAKLLLQGKGVDFKVVVLDVDYTIGDLMEICAKAQFGVPRSFPLIEVDGKLFTYSQLPELLGQ